MSPPLQSVACLTPLAVLCEEHGELGQVVQDLQLVTSNLVETVRQEVMKVDLSPLMSEIQAIRGKVEVSSALKRQNEHMTKSDFATALEEWLHEASWLFLIGHRR
eukprot:g29586.t1